MTEPFHDSINLDNNLKSDLSPLEYYMLGVVVRKLNEHIHNTKHSLKGAIVRVISTMN